MPETQRTVEQLFAKTMHFLTSRARSKAEVVRYLKQKMGKEYDEAVTQEVLAKLEQFNLLNDSSFAKQLTESYLRAGKGPKIIGIKLREKGVESETIRHTLENLDTDLVREAALTALTKKAKTLHESNTSKKRQLLLKFLYSRGFEPKLGYELIDANGELPVQ